MNTKLFLIPIAAALLASSCGENPGPGPSPSPTDRTAHPYITEDHKVEITFKTTLSYDTAIGNLISEFNKLEPNITVTYDKYSGNYSQLEENIIEGFAANNYPDVATAYPDHIANFLDYDKVVNLQTYMDDTTHNYGFTQADYDDIIPAYLEEGRSFATKGTYLMPFAKSSEVLFFNENILGKSFEGVNGGKAIDKDYLNSLTWEELFGTFAPAVEKWNNEQSEDGKLYHERIMAYSGDDNAFITFTEQMSSGYTALNKNTGKGELLFNNDKNKEIVKYFNEQYKKGYFTTAGIEGAANLNVRNANTYTQCDYLFATGSTGGVKYQVSGSEESFGTGAVRIPYFKNGKRACISQGPGLCALDHGDEYKNLASYLFIKFLTEKDSTLYWFTQTGYYPVRESCYNTDAFLDACSKEGKQKGNIDYTTADVATVGGLIASDYYTSEVFKGSSNCRGYFGSLFTATVGVTDTLTDEFLKQKFDEAEQSCLAKM